ncbi:hypothetical protein H4Q26_011328 [Puccinia striiformis f. sp. tritici PST-130]|nr:hypothetical protein H4Q26_011328 [Puccinia striiformis f. sp. tritici PST-130]
MTKKRAYNAERQYQRPPTSKRNRQHQPAQAHPQAQQSQPQLQPNHYHQAPQKPTFDPTKCAQQFERLSLSQSNYPPLNGYLLNQALKHSGGIPSGTQQNTTIVDNSRHLQPNQPWGNATPTTEVVNQNTQFQVGRPTNLYSAALQTNPIRQAFPGKSYQFQSGWTEVVVCPNLGLGSHLVKHRTGIYHQNNNNHQASSVRNPWNNSNQAPINPSSKITKPFTCHPSRPIVNLPQRASLLSANRFAILDSSLADHQPPGVLSSSQQPKHKMPKLQPQQAKSTLSKRPNLPLVMPGDVAKIDIVLDTNILLAYQHFLRALIPFLGSSCRLLIPTAVISELDVQKNRPYLIDVFEAGRFVSQQPMSQLARQASKWLLALVVSHPSSLALQKLTEESEQLQKHKDGDTRILTYAHQIYHQAKSQEVNTIIALLSNDTLLRLRAQSEAVDSTQVSNPEGSFLYELQDIHGVHPSGLTGPDSSLLTVSWTRLSNDKCCAIGRASIWIKLLGQLDSCVLRDQYKISLQHGPKITHLYGDEALVQYMKAAHSLLLVSGDQDERLGFLESILISSTLIDVLSQTLLGSPLLSWHFRSELFLSTINVVQGILEKLSQPWKILNSEYIKISTTGISPADHRQHNIIWRKVIEKTDRPNSTDEKVRELEASFPKLMTDVKEILHNRPGSCSATIRELSDNTVYVPICFVLEHLFRLAIEMETRPSNHSVTLPGDIQVRVPLSSDLVRMTSALLDLQIIYESRVSLTQENNTTLHSSNSATSQRNGKHRYNKKTFKIVERKQENAQQSDSKLRQADELGTRGTRGFQSEALANGKNRSMGFTQSKNKKDTTNLKHQTQTRSKADFDNGKKRINSGTISVSSASVTKISQEIHELSISSPDSGSSDGSSDIVVLN